ncbi:N-acetylglucosamine-6-phosphate deacetylase [Sciscionella marina]|uniref:N-acetylglucosamine-6-phosphate deacetylase n=1 Tax=Sciscionella marina TaxID=508770 RepID=UPI00035E5808|nr:amidohydrolase family protein [Sciscionella marina]
MSTEISGLEPESGRAVRVRFAEGVIESVEYDHDGDEDCWLTPGLVDLQVNGYAGHDVNARDVDAETVLAMTGSLRAAGVTTFAPTVVTASEEQTLRSLRAIAQARAASPVARHAIAQVHMEGPHISEEDGPRGAHERQWIRPPSLPEFLRWQQACDGLVGMVTLSPHYPESLAYIEALRGKGVQVAIGHTHCDHLAIDAAVDAGAGVSTHLGNASHEMLPRLSNYLWAQLAQDRLTAGFIADGHHLPAAVFTAMLRAKGVERSFLVSDAVALAGMSPGTYETSIGGRVELRADGRLSRLGTPFLAGAARSLADGVAEAIALAGITLAESVALATSRPARLLRPSRGPARGVLCPGAAADLIRFRWRRGDHALDIDRVLTAASSRGEHR